MTNTQPSTSLVLIWIMLLTSVSLAATAAFFAVVGLTTVYVGAILPVAIMASFIEAGKLVGASWVYRSYKTAPRPLTAFIGFLVIVAMFATSLGIFGFLSKAYIEHSADHQHTTIESERIIQQIETVESRRSRAQSNLDQINDSLNTLIEFNRISGPDGYRAVREKNLPTITELETIIEDSTDRITELTRLRFDLERELTIAAAEVGVIRFVAEFIWGEEEAANNYDRAVRILTLVLIVIFDPLAIGLLLAANFSLMQRANEKAQNRPDSDGGNDDPPPAPVAPQSPPEAIPEPEPVHTEEPAPEPVVVTSDTKLDINSNTGTQVLEPLTAVNKSSDAAIKWISKRAGVRYNN